MLILSIKDVSKKEKEFLATRSDQGYAHVTLGLFWWRSTPAGRLELNSTNITILTTIRLARRVI